MLFRAIALSLLVVCLDASHSLAQLTPSQNDALDKLQASQNAAACSATDASSCAQAAVKLTPLILGDSPMVENLRRLSDEVGGRVTGTPEMAKAVQWGIAGFRAAGVDVHTEKYALPATWKEGATRIVITAPASAAGHDAALRGISVAWAPATPAEGIEAPVVDIGSG